MQLWMNVYRSGWFHRKGKPGNVDFHAGDFYLSEEQALRNIDPPSHYVMTVPFEWDGPAPQENPPQSVPVPLSVSRREAVSV